MQIKAQIEELEYMLTQVSRIESMAMIIRNEYFDGDKPNERVLKTKYKDYKNLMSIISLHLSVQRKYIKDMMDKIESEKLNKQNLILLKQK